MASDAWLELLRGGATASDDLKDWIAEWADTEQASADSLSERAKIARWADGLRDHLESRIDLAASQASDRQFEWYEMQAAHDKACGCNNFTCKKGNE